MFFFKGKDDMGLDASLSLLDLSADATVDDANQAYTYLHRMIELYHRDNDAGNGDRREDLELLTCAYEKAVSYLSDPTAAPTGEPVPTGAGPVTGSARPTADLHFTINFSETGEDSRLPARDNPAHDANAASTVENAIAIITRRLDEAQAALAEAREAVDAANEAVATANRRLEETRQDRIDAVIAAKSAKSRAMLMDIEVKRATEAAIAVAEKIKDRVTAAKQAAQAARTVADAAREKIRQATRAEEHAAAEAVCAEDRLEKAEQQLTRLTHAVVEARGQLRVFKEYGVQTRSVAASGQTTDLPAMSAKISDATGAATVDTDARQQILSDLMEIEDSLSARKKQREMPQEQRLSDDRRHHERLCYPTGNRPMFAFEDRTIPVLNLSQTGMGLEPDPGIGQAHLVRGAIVFDGLPPVNVTGRVVRQDEQGLGLRLVTRIGNHLLDRQRTRLSA